MASLNNFHVSTNFQPKQNYGHKIQIALMVVY